MCNENGYYAIYNSDRYGFNNPDEIWDISSHDVLLIGDSYVQGMCVSANNNLNGQLKKLNLNSINFGVAGNGPLLEFATFKEYKLDLNLKSIVLFVTPDNDFYDLSNEKNNKLYIQAGAGIVADSNPEKEYQETVNKAKAIIEAAK